MSSIRACELPAGALLGEYKEAGAYTDCYVAEVARQVSQAEYVEAFYTTAVFKLERLLLGWLVSRPSTDTQAQDLASGNVRSFAAWNVEGQSDDQLLLSDFQGRTRSWLMSAPVLTGDSASTCLYFGSAVVTFARPPSGRAPMSFAFRVLLGFHKVYSRVLLRAAIARLARTGRHVGGNVDSGR